MPKIRKKKPGTNSILIKHIGAVVKVIYSDIYFIGDAFHTPSAFNAHALKTHLRGADSAIGFKVLVEKLCTVETDWFMFMVCFFKTPNGEIIVATGKQVMESVNTVTFAKDSKLFIDNIINNIVAADDDLEKENLVTYGYMCGPHDIYDFEKMEEPLIDRFFAINILDKSIQDNEPVTFDSELLLMSIKNSSLLKGEHLTSSMFKKKGE